MTKLPSLITTAMIGRQPPTSFFPWFRRAAGTVALWAARSRQRHHLANLNETALKDIGLTNHDVRRETAKAFWQK